MNEVMASANMIRVKSLMAVCLSINSPPIWAATFMLPTFFLICLIWLRGYPRP